MTSPQYELDPIVPGQARSTSRGSPTACLPWNSHPSTERSDNHATESLLPVEETTEIARRDLDEFYSSPTPSLHNEILPAYFPKLEEGARSHKLVGSPWIFLSTLVLSGLILLQWIGLVYASYRPFSTYQKGYVGDDDLVLNKRLIKTLDIMKVILSLLVIISVSAVLSRCAVLLTQRRNAKPGYNLGQIFAIASEGWLNIPIMWRAYGHKKSRSLYLIYGFSLCVASILIYSLQQGFTEIRTIKLPSLDLSTSQAYYWRPGFQGENILYTLFAQKPFLNALRNTLINTGPGDDQPNLWNTSAPLRTFHFPEPPTADIALGLQEKPSNPLASWFSLQNNTYNNGLFKATGLRMNTSVLCESIPSESYPQTCPGNNSWSTSIHLDFLNSTTTVEQARANRVPGVYSQYDDFEFYKMSVKVCVPGNRFALPWNVNNTTQTIEEVLYFDISSIPVSVNTIKSENGYQNYTRRCTSRTTSGYFYLPDYNQNASSLLLASESISGATINQHTSRDGPNGTGNAGYDSTDSTALTYHGPLLSTAMAFFPDFSDIVDHLGGFDSRLGVQWPLQKFTRSTSINESYLSYLSRFFINSGYLENSVRIGTFLATKSAWEVAGTGSTTATNYHGIPRDLGVDFPQPYIPLPAVVIISFLVAYVAVSLIILGFWNYVHDTWTPTLDPLALLLLSRDAAEKMPKIPVILHRVKAGQRSILEDILDSSPGVIGDVMSEEVQGVLAVGAEGLIGTSKLKNRKFLDGNIISTGEGVIASAMEV